MCSQSFVSCLFNKIASLKNEDVYVNRHTMDFPVSIMKDGVISNLTVSEGHDYTSKIRCKTSAAR